MVQTALDLLRSVFAGWETLWRWLFWVVLLGGLTLLSLRLFRREAFDALLPRLREILWRPGAWGAALVVFGLAYGVLGQVVLSRVSAGENASASRSADPDAAPTTQGGPRVTYLKQHDYERTLVLPPALLKTVKAEGVQVLAPYLGDPTAQNITRLRDRFWRSGRDIMFTRTATLLTEEPLRLDKTLVNLNLDFVSPMQGARRSYYNADFRAQYAFTNPFDQPVSTRFVFPLPQGSGTLADFQVIVNGQELQAADLMEGSGWQGELQPHQTANVTVTYRHQGARGWQYLLSNRREPIRNFSLNIRTSQAAKFARYSLYPTRTARTLGGTNLSWDLKNVITAQNISLSFTTSSLRETLTKLYTFMPFALLLAGAFGLLWARWRNLSASPLAAGLAVLGVVGGAALGGVLLSYLPAYLAAPLGALLGTVLALRSLGREFWLPVLLATLLPLAFLFVNHAGLLIVLVGLGLLTALIWTRPGRPARPQAFPVQAVSVREQRKHP